MTDMKPLENLRAEFLEELREVHQRIDSLRADHDKALDGCRIRLDVLERGLARVDAGKEP